MVSMTVASRRPAQIQHHGGRNCLALLRVNTRRGRLSLRPYRSRPRGPAPASPPACQPYGSAYRCSRPARGAAAPHGARKRRRAIHSLQAAYGDPALGPAGRRSLAQGRRARQIRPRPSASADLTHGGLGTGWGSPRRHSGSSGFLESRSERGDPLSSRANTNPKTRETVHTTPCLKPRVDEHLTIKFSLTNTFK